MSSIELQGSEILVAQLLALPDKVRTTVEREAVFEANKLLIGTIRSEAPKDSGALQKSVSGVVRQYQNGRIVLGVVGPEYNYTGAVISKGRGKKKSFKKLKKGEKAENMRRPAKYAHLVEGGTAQRKTESGANRGSVSPNPFMAPSLEKVKAQIQKIFENAINKAVESL
jgi:HK97 gp10 family phage protein